MGATIRRVEMLAYLALGLIQGLTEFLPVSSSGHLVLAQHWLGINPEGALTEILLHIATLISVVVVYRNDILAILRERRWDYLVLLAAGTAVTVAVALPLRGPIAALTDADYSVRLVGGMLLVTAAWLVGADIRLRRGDSDRQPVLLSATLIGLAQAVAVIPGISRSGATIGTAVQCGIGRDEAARFSFLLSIPVILGAGIISVPEIRPALAGGTLNGPGIAIACVAALLSGIAAIHLVLCLLRKARLAAFAAYCALLGAAALAIG